MSNLDGAEAQILNFAAAEYVYGQIPCLLRHVRCHLKPSDPRRQEFERIARRLSVTDVDHPLLQTSPRPDHAAQVKVVEEGGL